MTIETCFFMNRIRRRGNRSTFPNPWSFAFPDWQKYFDARKIRHVVSLSFLLKLNTLDISRKGATFNFLHAGAACKLGLVADQILQVQCPKLDFIGMLIWGKRKSLQFTKGFHWGIFNCSQSLYLGKFS